MKAERVPYLVAPERAIAITGVNIRNSADEPIYRDWQVPESVLIGVAVRIDDLDGIRRHCSLDRDTPLILVGTAWGTRVRSRVVFASAEVSASGKIHFNGEIPEGLADQAIQIRISLEVAEDAGDAIAGFLRKGTILWSKEWEETIGNSDSQIQVRRKDLSKLGINVPWTVEIDLSDLDRAFTQAVAVYINSGHELGAIIQSDSRGTPGGLHRKIRRVMFDDIERQILLTALCDKRIREMTLTNLGDSVGAVLRQRIAIAMPIRSPQDCFEQFLTNPIKIERMMVKSRLGANVSALGPTKTVEAIPWLPKNIGRQIMETYQFLGLSEIRERSATYHTSQTAPQNLTLVSENHIATIRDLLREVADECDFPEPMNLDKKQHFDRLLGTTLAVVLEVPPTLAAGNGMWRFLSCVVCPELSSWRYKKGTKILEDRYLGGDRDLLRSRWWRAWSLGPDLTWAPKNCTPLREDDFTSLMERPTIGYTPILAKALRDCIWRHEGRIKNSRMMFVRALAKGVVAERKFRSFDSLTAAELTRELDRIAESVGTVRLKGKPSTAGATRFQHGLDYLD